MPKPTNYLGVSIVANGNIPYRKVSPVKAVDGIKVYRLANEAFPKRFFNMDTMETIYEHTRGKTNEPHRHDFYTIVWVRKGKGNHLIDFNTYPIDDNLVFFISPGQIHQIDTPAKPEGCVITFSSDFLVNNDISTGFITNINLFKPYSDSPPLVLVPPTSDKIKDIVDEMYGFFNSNSNYKYQAIGALMKLFLIHCNNVGNPHREAEINEISTVLFNFRQLVETHFRQFHKVKEYAELLFITPKHLNEVIKDAIGCTAKDYILDRISMEAKRMLLHSDNTVKQIAFALGFKEPLNFSAFFKKCTGLSPSDFRNGSR